MTDEQYDALVSEYATAASDLITRFSDRGVEPWDLFQEIERQSNRVIELCEVADANARRERQMGRQGP